ncbi:MAG: hydroxyacylglutathione hydrolase [Chlamydiales bacterium]|jgi:hydroxyacylglutathione hydrolase
MILEQHYLDCLAQASYFIADPEEGTAVVVDPRRDVDLYLERAEHHGVTIRHVILTHFHADFLAGHLELVARTGATLHLGRRAVADYPFEALSDGDVLALGKVRLEALETPGHTPESISILVFDLEQSESAPHAVLTGDTLFIGDVGRPDLMASVGVTADELGVMLYDSLRQKLMPLPPETIVYPGHGAGSACGKNLSTDTSSTIGAQLASNYALAEMPQGEFVELVTANLMPPPAYFPVTAGLNREEHANLPDMLESALVALNLEAFLAARSKGAQVLDVRPGQAFKESHLAGSTNIGLGGKFASWAGTLLDLKRPIVLVAEPGQEREAALRLGRIGLDKVIGYLDGGPQALPSDPSQVGGASQMDVAGVAVELASAGAEGDPRVLDVRTRGEFESGHVEGALHMPLAELAARKGELRRDQRLFVCCKSGYRSMAAISMLQADGFTNLVDTAGGFDAWLAADLPVTGEQLGSCSA